MDTDPTNRQIRFETGLRLHQFGRFVEAEAIYRQVLVAEPCHADSLHLLGVIAAQNGRNDLGIRLLDRAVSLNDLAPQYHANLAVVLKGLGRLGESLNAFKTALEIRADDADAFCNLGSVLKDLGRLEDANTACRAAIILKPDFAEAHTNLGTVLRDLGRIEESIARSLAAIRVRPDLAQPHYNLANAFACLGILDPAVAIYKIAITLKPEYAEAHSNLGKALKDQDQLEEAIGAYAKAIHIKPDLSEALSNLGTAVKEKGCLELALAGYKSALCFRPDYAEAHHNEAHIRLSRGEYSAGWRKYEWRWRGGTKHLKSRGFSQPQWEGEDLSGKTILLYEEQGLGDILQFCRYGSMVAARGATVILEVPRSLRRLLSWLPGIDRLVAAGEPLPSFDFHCPLLSLPGVFGTQVGTIPVPVPYLRAEDQVREVWRNRLGATGFKIGIAWQGNPNAAAERGRSVPLADFIPLARVPGVRLISLQKGPGVEQLAALPADMPVEVLGDDFDCGPDAFIDTAAVMMALDLVITVDTAIGHLAGALGQPVWIALQAIPHWVWLLDREDSPWYPTVRLFRQSRRGDWSSVFQEMATSLMSDGPGP